MLTLGKNNMRPLAAVLAALVALAVVLAGTPALSAGSAQSQQEDAATAAATDEVAMTSRVVGTAEDGRTVRGTFTPTKFRVNRAGTMIARGSLDAVIRGQGERLAVTKVVSMPVRSINGNAVAANSAAAAAPGDCDVLNLVLGPLDLDLLGLTVSLNRVVLDIVAVPGAGNLLGNPLCAVAGLLDGVQLSGLLGQIADLLNAILAILRG